MGVRDWPLARKLTAILVLVSSGVLLLTSGAFVTYEVLTFRRASQADLATLERVLAANSTAALAFANRADAAEILAALRVEPHVLAAALYEHDGILFATYPATVGRNDVPGAPPADGYRFDSGRLIGVEPVAQPGGRRLGTLYVITDTRVASEALRRTGMIGGGVMTVALLIAWALATMMQRRFTRPVLALAGAARAVSDRGDYSVRVPPMSRDELGHLTETFNQMLERIESQDAEQARLHLELQRHAAGLEERVAERTRELEIRNQALVTSEAAVRRNAGELAAANTELDAFAYSVSHDLRAPLRSIDGFSHVLLEDYAERLDEAGRDALNRVRAATQRMGMLIDDLLKLARFSRAEMTSDRLDLSTLAREIATELGGTDPSRRVEFVIAPGIEAQGDQRLMRVVLENLLGNGWKYTGRREGARIEFGIQRDNGTPAYFVRDNGAGFDMRYAKKLFGVFQRLHAASEFEGTGVGLATVRRIISRHGGVIWAQGEVDQGATFFFTLPNRPAGREAS